MKNSIVLSFFLILFFNNISVAQKIDFNQYAFTPKVNESEKIMSQGTKNCFTTTIEGVSKKDVAKSWGKFIREYGAKSKYDKKTKEYFADNAKIKNLSENSIDIYMSATELGEKNTELTVWFDLGGAYLSSYNFAEQAKTAETILSKFSAEMETKRINNYLGKEEDLLKDQKKSLSKLKKEEEKMTKDIEEMTQKIKDFRAKIENSKLEQEKKKIDIETQQKLIEQIKTVIPTINKF